MGGNVFKGRTRSIKKEHIEPTVQKYFDELKSVFPKKRGIFNKRHFKYLGSVGKKPKSGDIDFGIDVSSIIPEVTDTEIKKWNLDPKTVKEQFLKLKKRSRTATDSQLILKALLQGIAAQINSQAPNIHTDEKKIGLGTMFSLFPQYNEQDEKLDYGVQMDWMIGKLDLLQFSYYSARYKGNVKGLHRTQLMLSMFQCVDISFSHASGIKDKNTKEFITDDPKEMMKILSDRLNVTLTRSVMNDYFKLIAVVKSLPKNTYDCIIDTYLRILDKTRADIPEDLHNEYRARKQRLGLTGKFLPDDSLLKENTCYTKKGFKAYLKD
jgi:hypothetical protein